MNTVTYRGVICATAKPDELQTLGWRRFLTYRGVNYATAEPFPVRRESKSLTYRGVQYNSHG